MDDAEREELYIALAELRNKIDRLERDKGELEDRMKKLEKAFVQFAKDTNHNLHAIVHAVNEELTLEENTNAEQ